MRHLAQLVLLALPAFVLGCGLRAYDPVGRPWPTSPAAVRALGCLDVGVTPVRHGDRLALDVRVGNRCPWEQPFAIASIVIRDSAGQPLHMQDPRGELVLVHVDPGTEGRALVALDRSAPVRVCVDVSNTAPAAPQAVVAPVCFADGGAGFEVVP